MFGNWSKRRKVVKDAENYLKATDVVSRPMAILMTVAAFVIIGALLFSVFLGGRWAYRRIKGDDTSSVATVANGTDGPGDSANTENKQQEFPPIADGKTNTKFAWDTPLADGSEPIEWFHEIYNPDGTPYRKDEVDLIKKLNGK